MISGLIVKRALPLLILALAVIFTTVALAAPTKDGEVIPLIEMRDLPLTQAIRELARKAHLNILLDPRLAAAPYDRMAVSIRWQNVTAREALTALLDNYDLVLVETPRIQR
jgi:hypothetical protein